MSDSLYFVLHTVTVSVTVSGQGTHCTLEFHIISQFVVVVVTWKIRTEGIKSETMVALGTLYVRSSTLPITFKNHL